MIDMIIFIIFLVSIVGIVFIIFKKFPLLSRIDTKSIKEERENITKQNIISKRLERKFVNLKQFIINAFKPLIEIFRKVKQKVIKMEGQYHLQSKKRNNQQKSQIDTQTTYQMKSEIDDLVDEEEYEEAEKKLIELISTEPKNPKAYRQLGELYMHTRDYKHAQETFKYILTLDTINKLDQDIIDGSINVELALDYINLGLAERALANYSEALKNIEQACKLEANNPKNLDLLLETSIMAQDRVLAWEAYDRLKAVNPENQKLNEYKEKINQLDKLKKII